MYNAESIFQNIFLSSPYFYDQLEGGKSSSSKQSAADRQQQGIRVAAVLILLSKNDAANGINHAVHANHQWSVLLTIRTKWLRRHPGEVSFPGGMRDFKLDKTPVETAIRETYEEIGLPPSFVRILGILPPVVSLHHIKIYPVMGIIESPQKQRFDAFFSANEVDGYFWASLDRFLSNENHQTFCVNGTETQMHAFTFDGHMVFGITATLCIAIAIGLFGQLPEYPQRIHNWKDLKAEEEKQKPCSSAESIVRAMFNYFGKVREFIEPERINAAAVALTSSKL